jgi:hypothetical protein
MHGESVFTVMVIPLNVPFLKPHNTDNILPVMSINAKESVELYQKAFAHLQDHLDLFRQGSFSVPAGEIEMSVPIEWALGLDLASLKTFEGASSINKWASICSRCQATKVTRDNTLVYAFNKETGKYLRRRKDDGTGVHLCHERRDAEGELVRLLVPIDVDRVIPCLVHAKMRNAGTKLVALLYI